MKKILVALIASLALFLAACGGSSPESIAEDYIKALFKFDYGKMKKLATEKNKAGLEKSEQEMEKSMQELKDKDKKQMEEKKELYAAMTVTGSEEAKISEDGNSATVKVTAVDKDKKTSDFKVHLIKEKDAWKVDQLGK